MKRKSKRSSKKVSRTKTRLQLPDLDQAKAAVLNSLGSPESQRGYHHAIDEFIGWYCSEPRLCYIQRLAQRPPRLDLFSRNVHQVEVEHRKQLAIQAGS